MNKPLPDIIKKAFRPKFEILEQIGEGGMATVYKAIQINLNRYVALKIIHPGFAHDQEFLARFHREAQLCSAINHPNIITIYDEGEIADIHYLAMEFLEGMTLDQLIFRYKQLEPDITFSYLLPIARALDIVHRKGLIHRDIKSSNIFITNEGHPVLMDFGIAHSNSFLTVSQTGAVIGTPAYMSPEQAAGVELDSRSDIYSFGVVLFECLSGRVPLSASNPFSTIHRIIYEQPPLLKSMIPETPEWLSDLVALLLQKEADKRPQTINQVIELISNPQHHFGNHDTKRSSMTLYSAVGMFIGLLALLVYYINFTDKMPVKEQNQSNPSSQQIKQKIDSAAINPMKDSDSANKNNIIYNNDSAEIPYFYQQSLTNN